MYKRMKKIVALCLTLTVSSGLLAGCGSKEEAATTEPAVTENVAAEETAETEFTDYSAGFPERVKIQIPVFERGYEGWNTTDNYYTQWIQSEFGDKYNVDVEYVAIGRKTQIQDFIQMIVAHTAPDIIFHYDMPQAVNYYGEGAIQDVNYDEVAFYAPTYWANMEETIKTYGQVDGHQAFIFAGRSPIYYNKITLVRQDWLEEVGAEMPTSIEEFNEVARKWKEAGLGIIGEGFITGSFIYEYPYIGTEISEEEKALYLDLNVAPFTWGPTKEFLLTKNAQYNEGIIDTEFYLADDANAKAKFVSGQIGTYTSYLSSSTDVISSLLANDPDAKVATLPVSANTPEGNNSYYYEYPPYGMIMGINVDSTPEERAAVYMFLEWMSQPESLFKLQHGVEGKTYTLDADGIAIQDSSYTGEEKLSQNNNKDYWCLVQEVMTYGDEAVDLKANLTTLAPAGYEYLVEDSYEYNKAVEEYGIISTIFTKAVESTAEYRADLSALWQEAYVACITCAPEEFEATYADYCEQYLDAGYQDILDEKQALLDEGSFLQLD